MAIVNLCVWKRQFISQPGVQGQTRLELKSILRVRVEIISTQTAREIASTLKEEDRLAELKARERIANREIGKDKKAVASDALEHIDLIMFVPPAEFEFVAAINPGQRTSNIEGVFVGIPWASNGVSDGRKSGHLHEGRANGRVQRRLVLESQTAGCGVVHMLVK